MPIHLSHYNQAFANVSRLLPFWKPKPTPPTIGEKLQTALSLVAKTILIGVAASAALYCGGHGLIHAGVYLQETSLALCGKGLIKAGLGAAWVGKNLFLSIAVPIYAAVHVLPKALFKGTRWLIRVGVPQLLSLIRNVANQVIDVALRLIKHLVCEVVVPLVLRMIRLYGDYISPVMLILCQAVQSAYNAAMRNVVDCYTCVAEAISTITVTIAKHAFAAISEAYFLLSTLLGDASAALWETLTVTVPDVTNQTIAAIQAAFSNTMNVLEMSWAETFG